MNRIMTTLALVFFSCAPALAEQAILEKAVPKEFEDYRSETEEATDDKLIWWFQGESDPVSYTHLTLPTIYSV